MRLRERLVRLLLVAGVIPAILAAGLPVRSCTCGDDFSQSSAISACCDHHDACCGEEASSCHCCQPKEQERSCCTSSDEAPANPVFDCCCGETDPEPVAPLSSTVELTAGSAHFTASHVVAASSAETMRSAMRRNSARLPHADLPTTLCTLLI